MLILKDEIVIILKDSENRTQFTVHSKQAQD